MRKGTKKKIIIQGGVFLGILAITITCVLRNYSPMQIQETIKETSTAWLLLALLSMSIYFVFEGVNITRGLRLIGNRGNVLQGIKYAAVGFFFSSVTPSATGGQPMQLYYMHKDGLSVGAGTLALLLEFVSYQTVTVLLAIFGLCLQREPIHQALDGNWYLLLIGIGLNFLTTMLVYLVLLFPKNADILRRFSTIEHRFGQSLTEYQKGAAIIKANKGMMIPYYLTTMVQMLAMYSVPYFVYRSYNLSAYTWVEIVLLQAVLYVSVSALPIPGAMGISESGFTRLFKILFPTQIIGGAMVLTRGISFYFYVLVTGCISAVLMVQPNNKIIMQSNRKPAKQYT